MKCLTCFNDFEMLESESTLYTCYTCRDLGHDDLPTVSDNTTLG